ncbi:unnamed protein product [marine sediment metagenome]|uniref:Uncharacterized protein n=1 Tax=marine sediment metagenome TaxID=412755 RepID=X1TT57_9ZZZZ
MDRSLDNAMLVTPTINSVHGRIFSHSGDIPAAGAEISLTVPARRRWRIISLHFSFATTVAAANRFPILSIDNGSILLLKIPIVTAQTASLTHHYYYSATHQPEIIIGVNRLYPLPPLTLVSDYNIFTQTIGIEDTDEYTAPILLIEEWINP